MFQVDTAYWSRTVYMNSIYFINLLSVPNKQLERQIKRVYTGLNCIYLCSFSTYKITNISSLANFLSFAPSLPGPNPTSLS